MLLIKEAYTQKPRLSIFDIQTFCKKSKITSY